MEERVPIQSGDHNNDEPSHLQPTTPPSSADHEPIFKPIRFPSRKKSIRSRSPLRDSETYIVQIPKDQIFSIPPPENAVIIQRYRGPEKQERSCCNRWMCFTVTLLLLAFFLGAAIWTFHILFSPKVPVFSVEDFTVKNPPPFSHKKRSNPGYQITFKTKNPNPRLGISYDSKGVATLLYKDHKIGTGNVPPGLDQDADGTNNIGLSLTGSNGALPDDIKTSIEDKKGKQRQHVSLSVKMDVPIKMNAFGSTKLWGKIIGVVCNFKVSSLGTRNINVVSQECQSKFK